MQNRAKQSSRNSSGTVIFEGLTRTTLGFREYAYDVKTALFVSLNNEKSAMLVSQINPEGVELFCNAKTSFHFNKKCDRLTREFIRSIATEVM